MPRYISGLDANVVLPEGKYPFEIISARLKTSKKGSEMIEVLLDVGGNGNSVKVVDFLVFDGGAFTSARIDQIRVCIGELILPGEECNVEPGDLLHKTGTAHIVIEEWNDKKRNKVGSYLEPDDAIPGLPLEIKPSKKTTSKDTIPY